MRDRLSEELREILLDTAGEPDHARMLTALCEAAYPSRLQALVEARIAVMRAMTEHRRALRVLGEREKLITDEAMKRLESLSAPMEDAS